MRTQSDCGCTAILPAGLTASWQQPATHGSAPSARSAHAACAVGGAMVVVGGLGTTGTALDDVHILNIGTCCKQTPAPLAYTIHTLLYTSMLSHSHTYAHARMHPHTHTHTHTDTQTHIPTRRACSDDDVDCCGARWTSASCTARPHSLSRPHSRSRGIGRLDRLGSFDRLGTVAGGAGSGFTN